MKRQTFNTTGLSMWICQQVHQYVLSPMSPWYPLMAVMTMVSDQKPPPWPHQRWLILMGKTTSSSQPPSLGPQHPPNSPTPEVEVESSTLKRLPSYQLAAHLLVSIQCSPFPKQDLSSAGNFYQLSLTNIGNILKVGGGDAVLWDLVESRGMADTDPAQHLHQVACFS